MWERAPKFIRERFESNRTVWDKDQFKSYLLSLEYPSNIERRENFPDVIKPMGLFHNAAKAIDRETFVRRKEMLSLIGTSKTKGKLVVQAVPSPGDIDSISFETVGKILKKSIQNNLDILLGDLHSHPNGVAELSQGDSYSLLERTVIPVNFAGVIAQGKISVVFKSWQTEKMLDLRLLPSSKEEFINQWYGFPSPREMNNAIAHRYSLVIYRGNVGRSLYKDFPR